MIFNLLAGFCTLLAKNLIVEMKAVSEALRPIGERLRSPLILSFFIAWIIHNWKITVALLWYDAKQWEGAGYSTIYDLISSIVCKTTSWAIPLLYAVAYTIFAPVGYYLIKCFNTWISKHGEIFNFQISKRSKVDIEVYLEKDRAVDKLYKDLEATLLIKGEAEQKLAKLHTEHTELKNQLELKQAIINDQNNKITQNQQSDVMLNGLWIYTNTKYPNGVIIRISDSKIYETDSQKRIVKIIYLITNFSFKEGNIFFNKLDSSTNVFIPAELRLSIDVMTGVERIGRTAIDVRYERINDDADN